MHGIISAYSNITFPQIYKAIDNLGYRMVFASMRAVCLFLRARAVFKFFSRAASTLENTDGERRAASTLEKKTDSDQQAL